MRIFSPLFKIETKDHWETRHSEPIPDRVQLLLDNALLKRESYYPNNKQASLLQRSGRTIHLRNNKLYFKRRDEEQWQQK